MEYFPEFVPQEGKAKSLASAGPATNSQKSGPQHIYYIKLTISRIFENRGLEMQVHPALEARQCTRERKKRKKRIEASRCRRTRPLNLARAHGVARVGPPCSLSSHKFSKVSAQVNLLYKGTTETTFGNIHTGSAACCPYCLTPPR